MKKGLAIGLALALLVPVLVMAQHDCKQRGPCCSGSSFDAARHEFKQQLGESGFHKKSMGIRHLLAVGDKINLTDDQQAKLEQMMIEFKLQSIDMKAEIQKAKVAMHAMKRKDAAEADVMRAIDDMARMKAEMQKMQYKHHLQAKAVLTDNQIDQLKQLRKEHSREGSKFKEKPGHGRRG